MDQSRLLGCLSDAQQIGAVGPGSLEEQVLHALGYTAGDPDLVTARAVDLGSGGGLPALPLALAYPESTWVLVETWARRATMLRRFVRELGLLGRVTVLTERAEVAGRGPNRGQADLVTARAFGPPAVALECAAPLLRVGGRVVLSVRHDEPVWPAAVLATLGLAVEGGWQVEHFAYRSATLRETCPPRFPRRSGQPERSPLF